MLVPDSDGRPVGDIEEAWSDAARHAAALARAARKQTNILKAQRTAILQKMLTHMVNDTAMNHGKFVMTPSSKASWVKANDLSSQINRLSGQKIERPFLSRVRKKFRKAWA